MIITLEVPDDIAEYFLALPEEKRGLELREWLNAAGKEYQSNSRRFLKDSPSGAEYLNYLQENDLIGIWQDRPEDIAADLRRQTEVERSLVPPQGILYEEASANREI